MYKFLCISRWNATILGLTQKAYEMKLSQFIVTMMVCYVLTISFSVPSQASKIDPGTIIGQWLFVEDKGDKAINASGNGHDGQIKGGNKRVKGKFGNALEVGGDTWVYWYQQMTN